MPLNPLRNDSTRPADGVFGSDCGLEKTRVTVMVILGSGGFEHPVDK
jgi:hypothetical protein